MSKRSNRTGQSASTSHTPINAPNLKLGGVIFGAPWESFYLEASPGDDISELQEKVKNKNTRIFGSLDTREIKLWKVVLNSPILAKDAPTDQFLATNPPESELVLKATWLPPLDKAGDHFTPPLAGRSIHFVVRAPALDTPAAGPSRGLKRLASSPDSAGRSDTGIGSAHSGYEIRPHATKRRRVSDEKERVEALSNLHASAWGKQWPYKSRRTILKNEMIHDETGPVNEDDLDFKEGPLSDILRIPNEYTYDCFGNMHAFTRAFAAPAIVKKVLVVRKEYEVLREALEEKEKKREKEEEEDYKDPLSVVVTGQPGIGKSAFLVYLLLHRLERCLPTAVQLNDEGYFIFNEQGAAFYLLATHGPGLDACWALADSNEDATQPCLPFRSRAKFTIQMSSPKPERWKEWTKQRNGVCFIMDLPTVPEIAAIIKEEKRRDPSSTLSLVRKWGPSTRSIIRSIDSGSTDRLEVEADEAAQKICAAPFQTLPGGKSSMPRSEGSTIVFMRRPAGSLDFEASDRFIPTPHLIDIFDRNHQMRQNINSLDLFHMLSLHSLTRTAAGWLHEQSMHRCLSGHRGTLELFQGPNSAGMNMTASTNILPGTLGGLKSAGDSDFYWIPSVVNFPGVDSVLGDSNGNLFTFQATIADDHRSPEAGIKKVWAELLPEVRTGRVWHYVVVTKTEAEAETYWARFSTLLRPFTLGSGTTLQVWGGVLRS